MVNSAGETGVDILTGYIRRSYSTRRRHSTIINCYKRVGDSLERESYRRKFAEKIIDQLTRQQLAFDEMWYSFMPVCGTTSIIFNFYLKTVAGEISAKKKNLCFTFVDLKKAFVEVLRDIV